MAKPVHSMIRVVDEKRSLDFYARAFGLEISDHLKFPDFALIYLRHPSSPFEVELTGIEVFPVTNVIYLGVDGGAAELRQVHQAMNAGPLEFQEPFSYHPHITLAQELPGDKVAATSDLAHRLWRDYTGPRRFPADHAAFVQNSFGNCWIDLAEFPLAGRPVKS